MSPSRAVTALWARARRGPEVVWVVTLPDDSSAASVREHLGVTTLRVLLPFLRRLAAVLLSSGKYLIVIAPLNTLSSVTPGWEQGRFQ